MFSEAGLCCFSAWKLQQSPSAFTKHLQNGVCKLGVCENRDSKPSRSKQRHFHVQIAGQDPAPELSVAAPGLVRAVPRSAAPWGPAQSSSSSSFPPEEARGGSL